MPVRAPAAQSCSSQHDAAHTSAYGSAPEARFWLALEQHGPWGPVAATQSQLDPAIGARIDAACTAAGGRLLLIRPPGPHAHPAPGVPAARTVLLGYAGAAPWLLAGRLDDPAGLTRLDWGALAAGHRAAVSDSVGWLTPCVTPQLLVCTNGKRDLCCAVRARPVALAAATLRPGQVWECSHPGGHRFAPTGVLLPVGRAVARLDADLAVAALDAALDRRLSPDLLGAGHDRGCSALSPPAMVAESAVRAELGETAWAALAVGAPRPIEPTDGHGAATVRWDVRVRHTDGRSWVVRVDAHPAPPLPQSCGAQPTAGTRWQAHVQPD